MERLQKCDVCGRNKRVRKDTKQGTLNDNMRPNKVIGMNFIGLVDGRYLLVIVDFLSRRVQVDVYRKAHGGHVMAGLRQWLRECGPVRSLTTNQGRHFCGEQIKGWCKRGG